MLIPVSPLTASLLRIPCELVLDMGFVPALQDPGSRERQGLLHSFNRTVSAGQGSPWGGCGWGGGILRGAQLPPCTGLTPLHVGAGVPAAGGDGDQVGACAALQRVTLPGAVRGHGECHTLRGRGGAGLDVGVRATPGLVCVWGCPRREGSVVLEYDALFAAERVPAPGLGALLNAALGSGGARTGLAVGTAPVLRNVALGECGGPAGDGGGGGCAITGPSRAGPGCPLGGERGWWW